MEKMEITLEDFKAHCSCYKPLFIEYNSIYDSDLGESMNGELDIVLIFTRIRVTPEDRTVKLFSETGCFGFTHVRNIYIDGIPDDPYEEVIKICCDNMGSLSYPLLNEYTISLKYADYR